MPEKTKKIPRHEWAYAKFIDELVKYARANDLMDGITEEEFKRDFEAPEIKEPMMNALNTLLWAEDDRASQARVTAFREAQELLLSIRGVRTAAELKHEPAQLYAGLEEMIKVEQTNMETLSDKDLKELAGDDPATDEEIAEMKKILDE